MNNNTIIDQLFYEDNKIVGSLKYKKIRTISFSEKILTIFIIEVYILEKKSFYKNIQNFIDSNAIIGNFVILDSRIKGLETFFPYKIIKNIYFLRNDQFLKPADIYTNNLFDRTLDIYNNFCRMNKISIWTYRTKKENKKILKNFIEKGCKVYRSAFSYVVLENEFIKEFAYEDFKDFMKLVSKFPQKTKIYSQINLDKRHFTRLEDEIIIAYSNKKIDLLI